MSQLATITIQPSNAILSGSGAPQLHEVHAHEVQLDRGHADHEDTDDGATAAGPAGLVDTFGGRPGGAGE